MVVGAVLCVSSFVCNVFKIRGVGMENIGAGAGPGPGTGPGPGACLNCG